MVYHLEFSKQANNDITFHKKSGNKAVLKKLLVLLEELTEHPFTGNGKPEQLKYELTVLVESRDNAVPLGLYSMRGFTSYHNIVPKALFFEYEQRATNINWEKSLIKNSLIEAILW